MSQCTGMSKRTGQRCKAQALTGKDVCYHHQGRPPKHGLYSKYKSHAVGERITQLLEDPDLLDLKRPVALIEALIEKFLEDAAEAGIKIGIPERQALLNLAKEEARAIERYFRVTEGTKHTVRVEIIHLFLGEIAKIVNEEVTDARTRARIAERMGGLRLLPD